MEAAMVATMRTAIGTAVCAPPSPAIGAALHRRPDPPRRRSARRAGRRAGGADQVEQVSPLGLIELQCASDAVEVTRGPITSGTGVAFRYLARTHRPPKGRWVVRGCAPHLWVVGVGRQGWG